VTEPRNGPIVWHRGIDDEIPCMLVTRNLVCVARIFATGTWRVTVMLGPSRTFESCSWKNIELAKQGAEGSMLRCTGSLAVDLLDWTKKHRRVEVETANKKKKAP